MQEVKQVMEMLTSIELDEFIQIVIVKMKALKADQNYRFIKFYSS